MSAFLPRLEALRLYHRALSEMLEPETHDSFADPLQQSTIERQLVGAVPVHWTTVIEELQAEVTQRHDRWISCGGQDDYPLTIRDVTNLRETLIGTTVKDAGSALQERVRATQPSLYV